MTGDQATDIQIQRVTTSHERYQYRAPMKFGGRTVTECYLLNVECEIATRDGRVGRGFGSMPLSNNWAFPSSVMSYDQTLSAMTQLAERCRTLCESHSDFGHPIDLGTHLEELFLAAARDLSASQK